MKYLIILLLCISCQNNCIEKEEEAFNMKEKIFWSRWVRGDIEEEQYNTLVDGQKAVLQAKISSCKN